MNMTTLMCKGFMEDCAPERVEEIYGKILYPGGDICDWFTHACDFNCWFRPWTECYRYDLTDLTLNGHEVACAYADLGGLSTNAQYHILAKWYDQDGNHLFTNSSGYITETERYRWVCWIGYCDWEIIANGWHKVVMELYEDDVLVSSSSHDFEIFGIPVTPIITCTDPTPHFTSGCALLLHYDSDNDGVLSFEDSEQAVADRDNGIITEEELAFFTLAYFRGINTECPGCFDPCEGVVCDDICINEDLWSQACVPEGENAGECAFDQLIEENSTDCGFVPPVDAKGEIVNLDYPSSVLHGAGFNVTAGVHNTGGSDGQFRVDMYINGALTQDGDVQTIAAGATNTDMLPGHNTAPTSGTSMSCVVKCIRIT